MNRPITESKGFTLIEIVIVFSIMAIISSVGLASFSNFSKSQNLNKATLDLSTMINKAKSLTISQALSNGSVQNLCDEGAAGVKTFAGYAVKVFQSSGSYELDILCGNEDPSSPTNLNNPIETNTLSNNIVFDSVDTYFWFKPLNLTVRRGVTDTTDTVVVKNDDGGMTKTITVDASGNISVQ